MSKSKIISFFLSSILVGCTTPYQNRQVSTIDAQFQLQRIQHGLASKNTNIGIQTYQNHLSDILGSHCTQFPTDSSHAKLLYKKCDVTTATLKSISRMLQEYDAAYLGKDIVTIDNKLYYKDLEAQCAMF